MKQYLSLVQSHVSFYFFFFKYFFSQRLVGDNIDLMVHARIQSEEHQNRSIHWTQEYAALNRVVEPSLSANAPRKALSEVQPGDVLPNKDVQERLKQRFAVLVSRVVCTYLPKFAHLRDAVIHHIPHPYSKEMASKTETVSYDSYD